MSCPGCFVRLTESHPICAHRGRHGPHADRPHSRDRKLHRVDFRETRRIQPRDRRGRRTDYDGGMKTRRGPAYSKQDPQGRLPLVRGSFVLYPEVGGRVSGTASIRNILSFLTSHTGRSQTGDVCSEERVAAGSNLLPRSDWRLGTMQRAKDWPGIESSRTIQSLDGAWTGTETCFSRRPRSAVNDSESDQ